MPKQKFERSVIIPKSVEPTLTLLVKLGSIAVHAEEFFSTDGHDYDRTAIQMLVSDPEVMEWVKKAGPLLPVKRKS